MNKIDLAKYTNLIFNYYKNEYLDLTKINELKQALNVPYEPFSLEYYDSKNVYDLFKSDSDITYYNYQFIIEKFLEFISAIDKISFVYLKTYLSSLDYVFNFIIDIEILSHLIYYYKLCYVNGIKKIEEKPDILYKNLTNLNETLFIDTFNNIYIQENLFENELSYQETMDLSMMRYHYKESLILKLVTMIETYGDNAFYCEFKKYLLKIIDSSYLPISIKARYEELINFIHKEVLKKFNKNRSRKVLEII